MNSLPNQHVEIWGGIECTINRVKDSYYDQVARSGHRERNEDISLFAELGLKKMRYPILWEHHQPEANRPADWTTTESKLASLRDHGIDIIAGLVHHGSGPDYATICEDDFVLGLADYAKQVAAKFPWIKYYTPVNEPLTTARFCGLYGLWHPHEANDACFCRILVNECKATALAMAAIRLVNPDAKLVQTDDLAKVHSSPALAYQADFENERRWLSYDLLCGNVDCNHSLWRYLIGNNISAAELNYFREYPCPPDILGVNYYLTSERYLDECKDDYPAQTHGGNGRHTYADVEAVRVSKIKPDGLQKLLREAWRRYKIPIAVTEVHLHCTREEQMRWLNESWIAATTLRAQGIPILAITAWALLGSYGWDKLLTESGGTYESGVFDCSNGYPRPTILASMIRSYSHNFHFRHPALEHPGWWRRNRRITYGRHRCERKIDGGMTIAISGDHSAAVAEICSLRSLNVVDTVNAVLNDIYIWATIIAQDPIELRFGDRPTLYVPLNGDLTQNVHKALDLLLDGESGYWTIDECGILVKSLKELSISHSLAS
jgi:dTDP-4-dehydrorhamnose reductase